MKLRVAPLHLYKTVPFSIDHINGPGYRWPNGSIYTRPSCPAHAPFALCVLLDLKAGTKWIGPRCDQTLLGTGWSRPSVLCGWTEMAPDYSYNNPPRLVVNEVSQEAMLHHLGKLGQGIVLMVVCGKGKSIVSTRRSRLIVIMMGCSRWGI